MDAISPYELPPHPKSLLSPAQLENLRGFQGATSDYILAILTHVPCQEAKAAALHALRAVQDIGEKAIRQAETP